MTGNAVARQAEATALVADAKLNRKFLDAYSTGQLNRLGADEQAQFLFALGARLGLRAELGEIMIYQGKPYITLEGRIRNAHSTGLLVGLDVRPATTLERKNYGAEEGDALWVCIVYRRGATRGFQGWGHVNPKTDRNEQVARKYPREMAKKRARYDALRAAFPPNEEIGSLHSRFIEEAELQAQRALPPERQIASGDYEPSAEEAPGAVAADERASDHIPPKSVDAQEDLARRQNQDAYSDGLTKPVGQARLSDESETESLRQEQKDALGDMKKHPAITREQRVWIEKVLTNGTSQSTAARAIAQFEKQIVEHDRVPAAEAKSA